MIYLEMEYKVQKKFNSTSKYEVIPLKEQNIEECRKLYHLCFTAGDAEFYFAQNDEERQIYFNEELGIEEAIKFGESILIKDQIEYIGFIFLLDLGRSIHISCMCIRKEYQNNGIGTYLLEYASKIAMKHQKTFVTLGTEKEMRGYNLYNKFGFKVVAEHKIKL